MTNSHVGEPQTARGIEFVTAALDYIKFLVAKSSAELERGHHNEAHEALLAARRTYAVLTGQVAALSAGRAQERQYLIVCVGLADQAMARSERRLAAHVRTDESSTSPEAYLAQTENQHSTHGSGTEIHGRKKTASVHKRVHYG